MDKIEEMFKRGIVDVFPSKEKFVEALSSSRKLKIYIGADPTAPQLHLGHSTNFLLLKTLQDMGHKIIILIGDFTGMIGDPTDKSAARRQLTKEEVFENAKTYKDQLSKILNFSGKNAAEIKYNSEWLSKLAPEDFIRLTAMATVQQMMERDMFQKRLKEDKPIYIHEFLYPLMQGYDSVAMEVDAEMGGTDQTFNMLVGRQLLKELKNKEKFVITTELLVNPKTGKKLMSKSEGNFVGLNDKPDEMFGKVMSLPDEVIEPVYRLCTGLDLNNINFSGHPMELKKNLAWEIVRMYHGRLAADKARQNFEKAYQEVEFSEDIAEPSLPANTLLEFLTSHGFSSSEAKRLLNQGSVDINGSTVKDRYQEINEGDKIRIGKKIFYKVEE